jgi:hypothetical protein
MPEQKFGQLNIIVAVYGLQTVTEKISKLVTDGSPQTLHLIINNKNIGEDGWVGQRKSLMIVYDYDGGDLHVAGGVEGEAITINPDKLGNRRRVIREPFEGSNSLSVLAATYGPDDVTYKIKSLISSYNTLSFPVDNTVFGDAWYGVAKTLVIVLGKDHDVSGVEIFTERETCYIDLNEIIPTL